MLIVEDHALLAQSLAVALKADGFEVERCIDLSAETILSSARDFEPAVVLLDLEVGGELGNTIPLIEPLQASGARVVMLTGVTDRARLAACVEAGAIGVVSKAEPFERLLEGVREAVELGTLLSPGQRDDLMDELRRQRREDRERLAAFTKLTSREQQVLAALIDGKSADAIASEWVVSIATVRSQIRSLLQKLGVNSQLAAVALARKADWGSEEG